MIRLLIALQIIFLIPSIAHAYDRTITVFEISVTRDATAVNLNIPADFHFRNIVSKNQIEITFENCGVNLLGDNSILVPSFSPLFEFVELKESSDSHNSKLIIQLARDSGKPQIVVKQSMQSVTFEFRKDGESIALIADEPMIDIPEPREYMPDTPSFRIEPQHQPVNLEVDDITDPVMVMSDEDDIETNLKDKVQIKDKVTIYDSDEIEPIEETHSETQKQIIERYDRTELEAIHYSEGRIHKDTLTFEFSDGSPEFYYDMADSNSLILTFHNVIVPVEILPDDLIRRQVSGTFLRTISLEKFVESGAPGLKVVLTASKEIDIKVNDLGGVMEVILLRKVN